MKLLLIALWLTWFHFVFHYWFIYLLQKKLDVYLRKLLFADVSQNTKKFRKIHRKKSVSETVASSMEL